MRDKIKNVGWMFLMQIMVYPIQLLLIPIITENLGSNGYGEYIYGLSVIALVIPIIDFGTTVYFQSIFPKISFEEKQDLISKTLGFKTVICSVVILIISIICFIPKSINPSILLLIGWPIFSIVSMDFVYLSELRNQELFKRQFIQKVVLFSLAIPLIQIFKSIDIMYITLSLSYVVPTMISVKDLRKFGYKLHWKFNFSFLIQTLKNNSLYFLNNFTNIGFSSINVLMIEKYLGLNHVASFSIMESVSRASLSLISSINSVLYPLMSKNLNSSYLSKGVGITFLLYTTICVTIYLMRDIIYNFFQVPIMDDLVIVIMVLALLVDSISRFLEYNFLAAIGKGNIANVSNILGLIAYLPICYLLSLFISSSLLLFATTFISSLLIVLSIRVYFNYKLIVK